jgi:photosystem II stability/assembly factor-like uncharacterized protein
MSVRPIALSLLVLACPSTGLPATGKAAPAPASAPSPARAVPESALRAFAARSIGPAVMGGRVTDVALDPENPAGFWVALATGGVFRTANGGATFEAVFEGESVASVGAVAVSPADPKTVWVGTGEGTDRNTAGWGDGVYRSTDRGAAWTRVGLTASRAVARIAVHPKDPKIAYVAALGSLWTSGGERGLYKTTDGGASWTRVLGAPGALAQKVGACDVVLDPADPEVVYAALYARLRTPWSFASGPEASDGKDAGGIFKSTDGGATWKKLGGGLPGSLQRVGLDVFRANPKIVYAIVQTAEGGPTPLREVRTKRGGVFRSEDGGETWTRTSPLDPRPFYFSQIRVDPANDKRVYVLGIALHVSDDGARSFREDLGEAVHPDGHALAVDPRNPKHLVLGTDGGVYQSFEGGKNWAHLDRIAAGEYYRVALDDATPYRIAGGLQDNLNWLGPSATGTKEGIRNADWINLGGGDGFSNAFDPGEPGVVYAESQGGNVFRMDLRSGERKDLRPQPEEGHPAFRFHWCAPLLASRHEKGVLFLGGNRVFRLTARGEEWVPVSPDLSAQDPGKTTATGSGAETYGVVYALAESPLEAGLLWAGTDDGKLWVTQDGGGKWTDLTASLPPAAKGQWIGRIEPSAHDAKAAYLAVEAYRSGNDAPLAFRTADLGRTWTSVVGNLPANGPVKLIREDPKNPSLLFAGTVSGLYVSLDRGTSWTKFGRLPTVEVDDLAIHPRERDLVIATHGRSLFIADDVSALEAFTPEIAAEDAHLFPPKPAFGTNRFSGWSEWNGKAAFRGKNPPEGAVFTYWVRDLTVDDVKITVEGPGGVPVAKLEAPGTPGFGRVSWDLKPTKEFLSESSSEGKRFVRPGTYTVTLTHGKTKVKQTLDVKIAEGIETR